LLLLLFVLFHVLLILPMFLILSFPYFFILP